MFQKICTNFPKEKVCTKDFFNDFQTFQNLCIKEYFSMVSSNVYSKSMHKDFSQVFFYENSKGFFNDFFKMYMYKELRKNLKNMYKLQSEHTYKSFPFFSKFHYVESEILGNR